MNDNDLERELRARRGPREAGYQPSTLPMTLDERPSAIGARPSRLGRAGLFVGVAAAGALAVAAVALIVSGPGSGPEVGEGSASPSAGASTPAVGACAPIDVMLSAEPWGGAAGSRGTVVTISLADGRYPCALSGSLTASVVDANGTLLVSGQTASAASVQLESNVAFTVGVAWSNWCADPPANPVSLSLKARGWSSAVDVSTPAGQESVPPCLGAGQPSSLSITDLQRAP